MSPFKVIKNSAAAWVADNVTIHCAALAYYTVFSVAPLLVIAIAIAGFFFGQEASRGEIFGAIQGLLGSSGAKAVEAMVASASKNAHTGWAATLAGLVTLIFA